MIMSRCLVVSLFCVACGCGKEQPGAPIVVIDDKPTGAKQEPDPKPESKYVPPKKKVEPLAALSPIDLRAYGLYALIDAPEGTTVHQTLSDITLVGPNGYAVVIRSGATDLAKLRTEFLAEDGAKALIDEPTALLVEREEEGRTHFRFALNTKIAGQPYYLSRTMTPPITAEQARRNLDAARGIRQTPALERARQERERAEAELRKLGMMFETLHDGSQQLLCLGYSSLRDSDLELLKLIPDASMVFLQAKGPLTSAGLASLESLSRLWQLSVSGDWVDARAVKTIATLSGLRALHISETPLFDAALEPIARLTNLEQLTLEDVRLGDNGLRQLQDLKKLKYLRLNGTDVGDGGIAFIKGFSALRELALSDTAITDAALDDLATLTNLRRLDLSETLVSDAAINALAKLNNLTEINLHGTNVTAAGVARLRKAIPGLQQAQPWPLEEPEAVVVAPPVAIDQLPPPDAAAFVAKFQGKLTRDDEVLGKPIVAIDLKGAALTDKDLAELRDLTQLRSLNLENCGQITPAALPYFAELKALEVLNLRGTRVFGDGLVHLKGLAKLKRLVLPMGTTLTSRQLLPLASLPDLELLPFTFPSNDHPVLAVLSRMTKLKELNLDTALLTNRKLAYVKGLKNLESLSLGRLGKWSDRGVSVLKEMPELKTLLIHRYQGSNAGLKALNGLSKLEAIELDGPFITDAGAEALAGMSELKILRLDNLSIGDSTLSRCKNLDKLLEIRLHATRVTDRGLDALSNLKSLEMIDLGYTKVTDAGLAKLKDLDELRVLRLDGTLVNGSGLKALENLPRLYRLLLHNTPIDDANLANVGRLSHLLYLDLSKTAITDAGLMSLKPLRDLKELNLSECLSLTNDVVPVLKSYRSLKELTLRNTKISNRAIDALREAMILVESGPK